MDDLIFIFTANDLYIPTFQTDETAETDVSDQRGRRKTAELHTSGAKRAETWRGGEIGESWPSTWRWRRDVRERGGRRTNDEASIRAVELQPDFKAIQVCLIENIKDIKMVTMFEYT